jgi:hypothetical protein
VAVPDERLDELARISNSAKVVATYLEFVDIAGLVKGASSGEGLGNKFLANIREVDAILHVLRCFEDDDVSHVGGAVDPVADAETVETELMLADLESLERRIDALAKAELKLAEKALAILKEGRPAREMKPEGEDRRRFRALNLLTAKPVLYVCNVDEEHAASGNALSEKVAAYAARTGAGSIVISARIEAEIAQLTDEAERAEFLDSMGLAETGLSRLIRAGYELLGLITYFTSGPKESRAWTVPAGTRAAAAAGRIHTDFERGFICAETIAFGDYVANGGEQGAKDAGRMRQEGRDYTVKDGDVILYRFNV